MKDKLLKYNAQVPRYTSYPTAPQFMPMSAAEYAGWLSALPSGHEASLYIHVPFCKEMCWYCGCHTTATRKYAPVEDYITLLLREIKLVGDALGGNLLVKHLHFGGGSPTMLQPDDFRRITETLRSRFDFDALAEIAIEADPRGATHDKAEAYKECGVNRASFGIQDFAPEVQAAINRHQDFTVVEKAVSLFRQFDIARINFDLMYGLPLQTLAHVEDTVTKSLLLSPDRIALFGYAHVPWMKKHMRLIRDEDLPDASLRIDQFSLAEKRLVQAGMTPVGLDHFVRDGDDMQRSLHEKRLTRNFQGYTTDATDTLIGFGMSSIGRMPEGFVQNAANITEYSADIFAGVLPVRRGKVVGAEDRLRAGIISSLMCYLEADISAVLKQHGYPPDYFDDALSGMQDMVEEGLVVVDGRRVIVNSQARQIVRVAAARFDTYFQEKVGRHAQTA